MQQRMTFWYLLGYSLSKGIAKSLFHYRVVGAENIIEEGPAIIASNHCSFFDPPLVGTACKRAIHYLARKSLLDWPIMGSLMPEWNVIPVDRQNAERSALMGLIRVIRSGGAALIFPEGTRTRDGNLQNAQAGVGMIVAKTSAPVVPVRIFGSYEAFPRDRKLPNFFVPITVVIGKPLYFSNTENEGRDTYKKISDRIMDAIANLKV